jgi:hypothetical protein
MQDSDNQLLKVPTETAKALLVIGAKEGLTWPKMARKILAEYVDNNKKEDKNENK